MSDNEHYILTMRLDSIEQVEQVIEAVESMNKAAEYAYHAEVLAGGDMGCGESFQSLMESLKAKG